MMGRGHATMGGAFWLVGCAAAQADGRDLDAAIVFVGAAVCAGWALAPDLDHPNSTVARSVGPVTRWIARGVAEFGVAVHAQTKSRWDRPDLDGHRTVTHTAAWALVCGLAVALAQQWGGPWVAAMLVFFAAQVGIQAALPPKHRSFRVKTGFKLKWARKSWVRAMLGKRGNRWIGNCRRFPVPVPTVTAAMLAAVAYRATPEHGWWLGLAVGLGSLIHCLGDSLTDSACPFLWPIPLGEPGRRRLWYPLGPPSPLRFNAGGAVERRLVQPLLVTVAVAALVVIAWPTLGPPVVGVVDEFRRAWADAGG